MKTQKMTARILAAGGLAFGALCLQSHAALTNGGFELGLTGWNTADQVGSDGSFLSQTGLLSPLNAFAVPAPPEGTQAAMTDSGAGGAHVLYQDFVVPVGVTLATIDFSLYLNNGAGTYFNPAFLDWARTSPQGGTNLNQQARVDIMTTSGDVFSVAAADVLLNLFQTGAATPAVTGYNPLSFDFTALAQAHAGETLRLRFAETDNVNFFNMGVDNVVLVIPAPSTLIVSMGAPLLVFRRRHRR